MIIVYLGHKDLLSSPEIRIQSHGIARPALFSLPKVDYLNATKALVLIGGVLGGKITNTVEVSPFSHGPSCTLPPLPEKLKWGSAGFVSRNLLVCGGETGLGNPSRSCWVLESNNSKWTDLGEQLTRYCMLNVEQSSLMSNLLFSSRSQAASTVSRNGQSLHIIGGRSHFQSSLESTQSVGLQEPSKEQQMMVDQRLHSSRFASVVTLSTGDLVITGGKTNQRDAFLISQFNLTNWSRLPQMNHGRFAHSSCSFIQDKEERVIVAGGWSEQGRAQASVEIYNLTKDRWIELTSLPSPRVYFSLQVTNISLQTCLHCFLAGNRC